MYDAISDLAAQQHHVLQQCRELDVKFIRLWFTDILGALKSAAITVDELEHAFTNGASFDGASIEGFARSDEADMAAVPDPATFQLLPWRPREQSVARMFCDVRLPSGDPFEGDPRHVLKGVVERAARLGFTFYVSPEIEFFYFASAEEPTLLDAGGYFDLTPLDSGTDLRRETVLTLEEMGIPVAMSHHEAAPSQHEIDLRHTDALTMADSVMTYRLVVKEIARRHGAYATFMPKPRSELNGSAMHLQLSLFRGEENAFFDAADPLSLSVTARRFMAGLLRHAPALALVTNQWANSYKRLVPGFEAPTYVTWSPRNHSDLLRVPEHRPGLEGSTRVEYRVPDAACNPYLALAGVLAAGLEGVEREYALPPAVETDAAELTAAERAALGVESLPGSLGEAIDCFAASEFMRSTLGGHVFESLLRNKQAEWREYRAQVSDWEVRRYLGVL
ncbi:MAG: glutamine synthetase family protein [Dehalococcoidia bacterium]